VGVWFTASVRECLARNQRREDRARVPQIAILAIAKRLRPVDGEGFDRIRVARMTTDGGFGLHAVGGGNRPWNGL
jgi:predicted kinase